MEPIREQLKKLFQDLNTSIQHLNVERKELGAAPLAKSHLKLLGQVSLMVDRKVSTLLSLAQTGDLDAHLNMENVVLIEFKKLLRDQGLVYDEDSYLIWIPPKAKFETFVDLEHVFVETIDPESALVSKAVKAPKKNVQLIREAILTGAFPTLAERIVKNGGKLEDFT